MVRLQLVCIVLLVVVITENTMAQTASDSIKKSTVFEWKYEPGIEFIHPQSSDRWIYTVSENHLVGMEFFKKYIHLSLYAGLTTTYAWGHITQYGDNFTEVTTSNAAFGIGPVFLVRFEPIVIKGFSAGFDGGGGFILYTGRFPHGGDIYNFMWRGGFSAAYRINRKNAIRADFKWMHVSNGQGLNAKNPSYEGKGISLEYVRYF